MDVVHQKVVCIVVKSVVRKRKNVKLMCTCEEKRQEWAKYW